MLRFELDGLQVTPNDILDFNMVLGENGQLSIPDKIILSGANADPIYKAIDAGRIYQKLSLNVWNDGYQIFRGFCDLQEDLIVNGTREVEVKIVSYDSYDWIDKYGNSVSFGVLYSDRYITDNDFEEVKFLQNFKPDAAVALTTSIALYTTGKTLYEAIKEISTISIESSPRIDVGDWLRDILKVILRVIYLILLIVAIALLLKQFIEAIVPTKGTFKTMKVSKMFEAICNYFGLTFRSNIFRGEAANLLYIPYKDELTDVGIPAPNTALYNCGDFLNAMKQVFNADIKIVNGELRFDRWDSFFINNNTILKNNFNNQDRLLDSYSFNTDEAIGNYSIYYQTDASELNTLDGDTLAFQESIRNIKGLTSIALPFAQGKNKTEDTSTLNFLKEIEKTVKSISGSFGSGKGKKGRKGNVSDALLVSGKTFTVDKIAFKKGQGVETVPARWWWDNFHYINSFTTNQWIQYDPTPMEMTFDEFRQIINTNTLVDDEGNRVQVTEGTYNPSTNKAEIAYRKKQIYAKGLKGREI